MRRVPRGARAASVAEALDLVQLGALGDRFPRQLSGGQQQRVALARAIVVKPAVLLLDEPLGALDKMLREEMQVELRTLQQRLGITAVFVTHDQEEALTLSDQVAVMRAGVIEQIGAPRAIYDRPRNEFVAGFLGASNFIDGTVASRDGATAWVDTASGRVPATIDDGEAATAARVGANVRLAVRPERVRMHREDRDGRDADGGVPARVRDIVYRGSVTHFYMDSACGSLLSYSQNAGAGDWSIGDGVICRWDAASGVLVTPEAA
jgi:putative spermidine/putrescine transport system ATP-binding protein/spermidine/putrescine transport system ATP-binding protein